MLTVKKLYRNTNDYLEQEIELNGWLRNNRAQKEFGFLEFHDGSFFKSLQVVYAGELNNFKDIQKFRVGSSVKVKGTIVLTPQLKQPFEIKATEVTLWEIHQQIIQYNQKDILESF